LSTFLSLNLNKEQQLKCCQLRLDTNPFGALQTRNASLFTLSCFPFKRESLLLLDDHQVFIGVSRKCPISFEETVQDKWNHHEPMHSIPAFCSQARPNDTLSIPKMTVVAGTPHFNAMAAQADCQERTAQSEMAAELLLLFPHTS
jgi:hypothetical protein